MKEYLDARNLPNPQPLVFTKRALAQGEFTELVVHVNNMDAKESVVRFARHAGFPIKKEEQEGEDFYITIANNDSPEEGDSAYIDSSHIHPAYTKQESPSPTADVSSGRKGITCVIGLHGNLENTAAERIFLSLPGNDLPGNHFRISHLILLGPALSRLCSSEEWRKKTEELIASGVAAGAEEREVQDIEKELESSFPIEQLSLFSAADLAELLLASSRVLEF